MYNQRPQNNSKNNRSNQEMNTNSSDLCLDVDIPLHIPKSAIENNKNIKNLLSAAKIKKFEDEGLFIDATLYIALEQAITKKINEFNKNENLKSELKNNSLEKFSDFIYYRLSFFYSVIDNIINKSFDIDRNYKNHGDKKNENNKDKNTDKDAVNYNNLFDYAGKAISDAIKEFDDLLKSTKGNIDKSNNLSEFNKSLLNYAEVMNKITKTLFDKTEEIKYPQI
ncbi:MAG: hypothetical protein ACP5RQ_02155 [Candidatus Micrarchaeia archaeon]